MISTIKKNICTLLVLLFAFSINTTIFAYVPIINFTKKSLGPGDNPVFYLGITGDSYGGYLINNLMIRTDLDLKNYCNAGRTVVENKDYILDCMQDKYKYIVLSIGVNDHWQETPIETFTEHLSLFCEAAKLLEKKLILHTYMEYPTSKIYKKAYSVSAYDDVLRHMANIYDNVYYIDLLDANGPEYVQDDNLHYNEKFYDVLIEKLFNLILDITKEE